MRLLLAYLFTIFCFCLTFNVSADIKPDTEKLLKKLSQLYDDGVLDKSQYENAKKKLLKSNNPKITKKKKNKTKNKEDHAKLLKNLTKLYNDGIFNKSQFEKAKKELLNSTTTKVTKTQPSQTQDKAKTNINKIINEIERLKLGDYYLFGHSTSGKLFWGSTKAKSQTTQIGKATSSSGITCDLISKQKTSYAPYKGSFELKCPNERINGSWTQNSGTSPGIGQAFTENGEILTAFFSYKQSVITNFAKKYFDSKETKIAKVKPKKKVEPKQEEFKPKKTILDNEAPVIEIASTITVDDASYEIEGKVTDKSNNIFVIIDGRTIAAKDGKFKVKRFSPVDDQVEIIAIDQWGNTSEPKLVNIIIDKSEAVVAKVIDSLDPSKIKTKSNNDRVALIIGIEKYDQAPEASFANLDAKYFYEYARKGFGVPKSNIKLLVDEDANLIQSLGTLNKWLPGKIKDGKTELIIFFAGHGLGSSDGKELYLLPQDSDPDLLARTALSRTELFKEIVALNPKSVTMFLDTCYSGVSRDETTLLASARPVRVVPNDDGDIPDNFTIFSASQSNQISSGLEEAKHGIFSYYLMKGLEGDADINNDKKITNGELLAYMDPKVSQKASELGRKQNPSLAGDPDKVLMSYQ